MILLGASVISDVLRPSPAPEVVASLNGGFAKAAISRFTIFELEACVGLLAPGRSRGAPEIAVARSMRQFGGRVSAFDAAAAQAAMRLLVEARGQGLGLDQIPSKVVDVQVAGNAAAEGLDLATPKFGNPAGLGLALDDPWRAIDLRSDISTPGGGSTASLSRS